MKNIKTATLLALLATVLARPVWADSQEPQVSYADSRIVFGPSIEESMTRIGYLTIDTGRDLFSSDYEIPDYDGVWLAENADKRGRIQYKGSGVGFASGGVGDEFGLARGFASSVTYLSPDMEGLRLVGSYGQDKAGNWGGPSNANPFRSSAEQWTAGLNYGRELSGFQYEADVYIGKRTVSNGLGFKENSYDSSGVGMELAYGGFSLGGSYNTMGQVRLDGYAARTNMLTSDGDVITIEAGYSDGPYRLALSYLDANSNEQLSSGVGDFSSVQLSGVYELDKNVDLNGSAFFAKFNDDAMTRSSNDNAWAAVVGVRMTF
ncbi:MAG: porin [Rhodospirillales bacterium]|nr:porin [Rhodospirillales bacterium]